MGRCPSTSIRLIIRVWLREYLHLWRVVTALNKQALVKHFKFQTKEISLNDRATSKLSVFLSLFLSAQVNYNDIRFSVSLLGLLCMYGDSLFSYTDVFVLFQFCLCCRLVFTAVVAFMHCLLYFAVVVICLHMAVLMHCLFHFAVLLICTHICARMHCFIHFAVVVLYISVVALMHCSQHFVS